MKSIFFWPKPNMAKKVTKGKKVRAKICISVQLPCLFFMIEFPSKYVYI